MAGYEWEQGTIALPSAEYAKVRQAVQQADTAHKEQVFALTQEFWKGLSRKQQADPRAYRQAGHEFIAKQDVDRQREYRYGRSSESEAIRDNLLMDLSEALNLDGRPGENPARVVKADMAFPTNRTTSFNPGYGQMSFDKKAGTVEWYVEENKNAVDKAHSHPVAEAFFDAIDKVAWTRGTGGVFTGNDEYRSDDHSEGGGENYVTSAFGPVGADREPGHCKPYTDSKGKRFDRKVLNGISHARFMAQMDAQRKAHEAYAKSIKASGVQPRGHNGHPGQYTYRGHGEPAFRL